MVSDFLINELIKAKSAPSGAYGDALSAISAATGGVDSYRKQKDYSRNERLQQFFDSNVPEKVSRRILPGMTEPLDFRSLTALGQGGIASLLKDPNADLKTVALLSSGGDKKKFQNLMEMFGTENDGDVPVTPATLGMAKFFMPPKKTIQSSSDVPQLRAIQDNLEAQLKSDISEDQRLAASENLQIVNERLAALGNVTLKKPKPKAPVAATKGGLTETEQAAIKALADALK